MSLTEALMTMRFLLRAGAVAAFAAAFLLCWKFMIALNIGDEIELLSQSLDPNRMTSFFEIDARAVTQLMAADDGFAIAYAVAFVVLAVYLVGSNRLLAAIALVFALGTALTDLGENSLTLAAVGMVAQGQTPEVGMLVTLFWLGQMKYLLIYVAAVLFAILLWNEGGLGKLFSVTLLVFPLVGIAAIAMSELMFVRALWMLVLLVVGGVFLVKAAGRSELDAEGVG
jgi:hypothetical protein